MAREKRSEVVRLVLAEKEKAEIQKAADNAGIPVAVYVRAVALAAAREIEAQKQQKAA